MKYALILLDGMADYPVNIFDGKTPLEAARTPVMDRLAVASEIGLVKTVPDGFKPGSDVANLGVLGYDVRECYTGRSPLEALSMGVTMKDDDLAMRANLVTLAGDGDFENKTLSDYGAGEISTEEARALIRDLDDILPLDGFSLHAGISYRHCLIAEHKRPNELLTPPHDITGKRIGEYLPKGNLADKLTDLIKKSYVILSNHPINEARANRGLRPANALWFWGEGTKPAIGNFTAKYGRSAAMISAVDLLKGIAIAGGITNINVAGATGTITTDFSAKAMAAIAALKGGTDFCMIHLEATDECGHQGDALGKKLAIELIDEKVVAPIYESLMQSGEPFKMLVMPDHYTPVSVRTHTSEPVPYMLFRSDSVLGHNVEYSEKSAAASGILYEKPWELTRKFLA